VVLCQEVREFLIWRLREYGLLPEVRGKVAVSLRDGSVGSFGEVSKSSSRSLSRGVTIIDSSHLQEFLRYRSRHDASTSWSRDQSPR